MRFRIFFSAAIFVLPFIAFAFNAGQAEAQVRAVLIGDSQGWGVANTGRLTAKLRSQGVELVDIEAASGRKVAQAVSGNMISNTLTSAGGTVQLVIFVMGGNERRRDIAALDTSLREAVGQANAGGSRTVVWVTPTYTTLEGLTTYHQDTATAMERILPGLGVQVINGWSMTDGFPLRSDGAHFTNEGYQRWACALASRIARAAGRSATDATCPVEPGGTEEPLSMAPLDDDTEGGAISSPQETRCPADPESLLPIKLGVSLGPVRTVLGLGDYINAAYRYLVSIVLIAAIVIITYGGFRYLLGAGIDDVQKGKTIIRDAIIGMVIVLAAYTILETVNPATTQFNALNPPTISCKELNIPPSANDRRCESNQDCRGQGEACVTTGHVFEAQPWSSIVESGAAGLVAGAVTPLPGAAAVGGLSGVAYGFYSNVRSIKMCSDGSAGSPCGENNECQTGSVCLEGGWQLCSPESGNPIGVPCTAHSQCASGMCGSSEDDTSNNRQCRGEAQYMSSDTLHAAEYNLERIPEEYRCFKNEGCAERGALCRGPAGTPHRFCVPGGSNDGWGFQEAEVSESTICFVDQTGNIWPAPCRGPANWRCMVCPPTGTRKWEIMTPTNNPQGTRIGSCRRPADAGSVDCTRSSP